MNTQARNMEKSISRVSLLKTLKNVKLIAMAMLTIDFIQRVYYNYPVTGLYILIIYAALPSILTVIIRTYVKDELEHSLVIMQKQYKYSRYELIANGVTMGLGIILLLLWQKGIHETKIMQWQLEQGPLLILTVIFSVLIGMYIYYKQQIRNKLKNNNL